MPNLQTSFIFTDDELIFLLSGLCDAKQYDKICGLLFGEQRPLSGSGKASLKKKRLLDEYGRVEPVVSYLFRQIAFADRMYKEDAQVVLDCQEIVIRLDRYRHSANMYRLTPLKKTRGMEEDING